jgi:hypothetical protein
MVSRYRQFRTEVAMMAGAAGMRGLRATEVVRVGMRERAWCAFDQVIYILQRSGVLRTRRRLTARHGLTAPGPHKPSSRSTSSMCWPNARLTRQLHARAARFDLQIVKGLVGVLAVRVRQDRQAPVPRVVAGSRQRNFDYLGSKVGRICVHQGSASTRDTSRALIPASAPAVGGKAVLPITSERKEGGSAPTDRCSLR